MDDSEFQLIQAIGGGDQLAFRRLVDRYQNPLLNFIYRYLGDRYAAEDLTQEVFLRVFQAAPQFEPRAKVSTWMFKIAYNLSMNELKRRKRRLVLDPALHRGEGELGASAPANILERLELEQTMTKALSQLPENQRAALLLRVNEGLGYREIGEILGVSLSSVESLMFRARQRLRKLFQRDVQR